MQSNQRFVVFFLPSLSGEGGLVGRNGTRTCVSILTGHRLMNLHKEEGIERGQE